MKKAAPKYRLEKNGDFVIENYNLSRPWAGFLPGIAGLYGIPLWAFYVNRGQCLVSAGVRSKDEALMEFLPANKAYQQVGSTGFRTFIKIKNKKASRYYEPFCDYRAALKSGVANRMIVRPYELEIFEFNPLLGLEITVSYFCIPQEPFAALAREVKIANVSARAMDMEFIDGLSVLVPYGVNNFFLKEMSRTIEAWMVVEGAQEGLPVYKLATDPKDTAQVALVRGANFYRGFREAGRDNSCPVIVDPQAVFGPVLDLSFPALFADKPSFAYPKRQVSRNKMPCALSLVKEKLRPGGLLRFFSLTGHVSDVGDLKKLGIAALGPEFISKKRQENRKLIDGIMDRIWTASGSVSFDGYARQTYLDNVLRGGLSCSLPVDGGSRNIYVFSRKHGDLERDYNRFMISATYFSEGEGNYRDVNQNRRSDCFFNPSLGEKNLVDFMNLIQLDGYNPLIFKGDRLLIPQKTFQEGRLGRLFHEKDAQKIAHMLARPFVLGEFFSYLQENHVVFSCSYEDMAKEIVAAASFSQDAVFGEGYWSDHWTYNTDLLESFRALYPDRMKEVLLEKNDLTYFDTHVFVKPREERYCIRNGQVRQYHAVGLNEEKNSLIHKRLEEKNKVRSGYGEGDIFRTTLWDKFICLVVNKLAGLDPFGAGLEMEADKPNWYDSLNGLPGLLGSSISETFELKRLILLLQDIVGELRLSEGYEFSLTVEVYDFLKELEMLLRAQLSNFDFWDKSNTVKEKYRLDVRRGVSGEFKRLSLAELRTFFTLARQKLDCGIAAGFDPENNLYRTYFTHQVTKHDSLLLAPGRHIVSPKEFRQTKLPLFLEGIVHALRTEHAQAPALYQAVKKSPLWDKKLKMFKVNASLLKESLELGRARAFTPGWLENESVWLHMEYKFLLELLKNGLYEEFYKEFFNVLIPFQDARRYGRSILENSSFIVSSAHPDVSLHGAGFVARLSGSTAEFIQMWLLMNMGLRPFYVDEGGGLALRFRPALAASLFTKRPSRRSYSTCAGELKEAEFAARTYGFLFLGSTLVTYINPRLKNTFGSNAVKPSVITLFGPKGVVKETQGAVIKSPRAQEIREGGIERIEVLLG